MDEAQPRIIRRYQNRKLYDTSASRYVTLEEIAAMIRDGVDVTVVDNKTKKDLTAITLTQIIFEQEKKDKSNLPLTALKRVIRSGSESLQDIVEKLLGPGMGTVQQVRQEMEKVVDRLAHRDKLPEEERQSLLAGLYSDTHKNLEEMSLRVEDLLKRLFDRTNAVTQLTKRLEQLESQVEELEKVIKENKKDS